MRSAAYGGKARGWNDAVSASVSGGSWALVDIVTTADGPLEARPG